MKSLLKEIREQPEHIRHIFMWVCVVIVFSVIGFIWFRNTEKRFVALLNPEQAQEERALAEKTKNQSPSPFATIFSAWSNLKANISELILGKHLEFDVNNSRTGLEEKQLPPQKLPLSE
jgi:cytosine/uracil/thiamine/allantoin permease